MGIDDLWAGMSAVKNMRQLVPNRAPSLVLCHNPDVVDHPQSTSFIRAAAASRQKQVVRGRACFIARRTYRVHQSRYWTHIANSRECTTGGYEFSSGKSLGNALCKRVGQHSAIA